MISLHFSNIPSVFRYQWFLFVFSLASQWKFILEIISRSKIKVKFTYFTICSQNGWRFLNLTLTFDLEMTLIGDFHYLAEISLIPRFSGWNNAQFRPKIVKILKFDPDLWPLNDLDSDFSLGGEENFISLRPHERCDISERRWYHEVQGINQS